MSPEIKAQGQKPYTVLKIDQLSRVGEMGGIEHYYRFTIKTRGGTILTVDIDAGDFTKERADPILTKRATDADQILAL